MTRQYIPPTGDLTQYGFGGERAFFDDVVGGRGAAPAVDPTRPLPERNPDPLLSGIAATSAGDPLLSPGGNAGNANGPGGIGASGSGNAPSVGGNSTPGSLGGQAPGETPGAPNSAGPGSLAGGLLGAAVGAPPGIGSTIGGTLGAISDISKATGDTVPAGDIAGLAVGQSPLNSIAGLFGESMGIAPSEEEADINSKNANPNANPNPNSQSQQAPDITQDQVDKDIASIADAQNAADPAGMGMGSHGGDAAPGPGGGIGGSGDAASGGDGDGEGCFVADTPIRMADGTERRIADVRVGDLVASFLLTGPLQPCAVTALSRHADRPTILVGDVETTREHPFLTRLGWRPAGELRAGDRIVKADGHALELRAEPLPSGRRQTVYNLTVAVLHTYVAGGLRVHNKFADGGAVSVDEIAHEVEGLTGAQRAATEQAVGIASREPRLVRPEQDDDGYAAGGIAAAPKGQPSVGGRAFRREGNLRLMGGSFRDGGLAGFLVGTTGGREDAVETRVPHGTYIVPADVVAFHGDGNSLAGAKSINDQIEKVPAPPYARGGIAAPRMVDVRLSHGELQIPPHAVMAAGRYQKGAHLSDDAALQAGADHFDQYVVGSRKRNIEHLKDLPGPRT